MSRDPSATQKARRAEANASHIKIKPISASVSAAAGSQAGKPGGGGFKKGGFKNAFGAVAEEEKEEEVVGKGKGEGEEEGKMKTGEVDEESEEDDGLEEGERYDPRRPTGCWEGCRGRVKG